MNYRITLTAGAILALLALPATAGAHERPSPQTVAKHVRGANLALDRVASLVTHDDNSAAAIELARNRRQTRAADREAARRRGRPASARACPRRHRDGHGAAPVGR